MCSNIEVVLQSFSSDSPLPPSDASSVSRMVSAYNSYQEGLLAAYKRMEFLEWGTRIE